jgi:mono/diheme cytochrome c family protein
VRKLLADGVLFFLVLGGMAGALILGGSPAAAQQGRGAAQGPNAAGGNMQNGRTVFTSQKCDSCHGAQGQGGEGAVAGPRIGPPGLALAMFIDQVRNPKAPMPAYAAAAVSDAALADVYAFLKSVPPPAQTTTGDSTSGKRLYVSAGCYECHDRDGQGGAGTGPRLAPNPIAFAAFLRQCRQPAQQMPPYTSKVLSDAQLADIYAFLQTVPRPPAVASIPLLQ